MMLRTSCGGSHLKTDSSALVLSLAVYFPPRPGWRTDMPGLAARSFTVLIPKVPLQGPGHKGHAPFSSRVLSSFLGCWGEMGALWFPSPSLPVTTWTREPESLGETEGTGVANFPLLMVGLNFGLRHQQ
ncbi:unnamed protein product [Pipistrellus nathusii]|uniref:Uncharacterized protein n=1 Tax=Pipistrellus nathusii TaxID=59473 RepID=A0ABP0AFJ2_PIPNA